MPDTTLIPGMDNEMLAELAASTRHDLVRAYSACLAKRLAHEETSFKRRPRVCSRDVTRDWRYKMGFIAALELAAKLPETARDLIEKREKRK